MLYSKLFKRYKYEPSKLIVVSIKPVVDHWLINDLETGWEYWKKDKAYVKLFNSVISTALEERVYGSETVPYERVHTWIKKSTEPVKMQQNVVDVCRSDNMRLIIKVCLNIRVNSLCSLKNSITKFTTTCMFHEDFKEFKKSRYLHIHVEYNAWCSQGY